MTDQPIIYWKDENITLNPSTMTDHCCYIRRAIRRWDGKIVRYEDVPLTTAQARSLGYALIARAIVTEPIEQEGNND